VKAIKTDDLEVESLEENKEVVPEKPENVYDAGKITFVGCESAEELKNIPKNMVDFCDKVISTARQYIKKKLGDDPLKAENWKIAYTKLPFLAQLSSDQFSINETRKSVEFTVDVKKILGIAEGVSSGYLGVIVDKLSFGGSSESVKEKDDYVFSSRSIVNDKGTYSLHLEVFVSAFEYSKQIIEIHSDCGSSSKEEFKLDMTYTKILFSVVYTDELYKILSDAINKNTVAFLNDLF